MADEKLTQKAKDHVQQAGDNAQQIQAETVIINNGINEAQARELYSEMSKKAMKEYTVESHLLIEKRIADFANVLIPRIEKIENGFEAFADPEFQLELKKAQVSSACTDVETDYEILSELLIHRIENRDSRKIKASISKAIEVVDKIDDDALCGLTVVYLANRITVCTGKINDGLRKLADAFSEIINSRLPDGESWMSYLDVLDVIRLSDINKFKKFYDYYFDRFTGYSAIGICKNSNEYNKALEILQRAKINKETLIDHELLKGYVRLPLTILSELSFLSKTIAIPNIPFEVKIQLNEDEKTAIKDVINLYSQDQAKKDEVKKRFFDKLASFEEFRIVHEWWDEIPAHFSITPVGEVIAHANAKRYIKLPDIKLD